MILISEILVQPNISRIELVVKKEINLMVEEKDLHIAQLKLSIKTILYSLLTAMSEVLSFFLRKDVQFQTECSKELTTSIKVSHRCSKPIKITFHKITIIIKTISEKVS